LNRTILRRDTLANWSSTNPILALGEPGVVLEEITLKPISLKIGDGSTAWNDLHYFSTSNEDGDSGGGGDVETHEHLNLEVLNSITETSIALWNSYVNSGGLLDGSTPVTGNILPDFANTRNLGSVLKPYNEIHCKDLFLSAHSLYVNSKKVIEDTSDTITISTDENQDLVVKTKGYGDLWLQSDDRVNILAKNGIEAIIPFSSPAKNLSFTNQSAGGNITFYATGANSQIQFSAVDTINFSAPWVKVNGSSIATMPQVDEAILTAMNALKAELAADSGNIIVNAGYF